MSKQLKIKIKSLAEEARIIRHEEQKLHGMEKWQLQHHRKTRVRDAARRSLIAYQYLRGKDWRINASTNQWTHSCDYKEVARMVKKYGHTEIDHGDFLNLHLPDKQAA